MPKKAQIEESQTIQQLVKKLVAEEIEEWMIINAEHPDMDSYDPCDIILAPSDGANGSSEPKEKKQRKKKVVEPIPEPEPEPLPPKKRGRGRPPKGS